MTSLQQLGPRTHIGETVETTGTGAPSRPDLSTVADAIVAGRTHAAHLFRGHALALARAAAVLREEAPRIESRAMRRRFHSLLNDLDDAAELADRAGKVTP